MARATGIEITETEVRLAEIEGSERRYRILGATSVPIEVDSEGERPPENLAAAVKAAVKEVRPRREQIVVGLPARTAVIREIVIPFTDPDQIRKVIKFESESHLPSSKIEEVIVGFYKISETGPRSRLLIFAVEKSVLRSTLDTLGGIGIEPTQVDLSAAALFSLTRLLPEVSKDEGVQMVLDIGDLNTTVMVIEGEALRMVRSMRIGSESLTRTLAHDLGIERGEAQTMTRSLLRLPGPFTTAGEVEAREPSGALTAVQLKQDIIKDKESEFARRIVNELRRTLSSVRVEGRVTNIWLTGPASTAPGLERELREAFRIPVRPLDVLANAEHKLEGNVALYAGPSLGLALKALEHDPVGLEFRQEEFAFARRFDRVKNPLLFGSALVLVLFAFLGILEFNKIKGLKNDMDWLAANGRNQYRGLIAQNADRYQRYLGFDTPKEPEDVLRAIEGRDPEQQLRTLVREVNRPMDAMREAYGSVFDSAENEPPPEQVAASALKRLDQWLAAINTVQKKFPGMTVDKINIGGPEKIQWTVQVPGVNVPEFLPALQEELEKVEGMKKYDSGTQKAAVENPDIIQFDNMTIEWEREE